MIRDRDKQLLEFIAAFIEDKGYAPSFTEMMAGIEEKSKNGIHLMLNRLQDAKKIRKTDGVARSIQVLEWSE